MQEVLHVDWRSLLAGSFMLYMSKGHISTRVDTTHTDLGMICVPRFTFPDRG